MCAQVRLLQHGGDLVCGMDWHVDVREGWDRHWRNIPAAEIMPYGPHGPQLGVRPPLQAQCCTRSSSQTPCRRPYRRPALQASLSAARHASIAQPCLLALWVLQMGRSLSRTTSASHLFNK